MQNKSSKSVFLCKDFCVFYKKVYLKLLYNYSIKKFTKGKYRYEIFT